jgi:hypothetical protein
MSLKKAAQGLCVALFASLTVACGAIEVPMTLAFDDEADNNIGVTVYLDEVGGSVLMEMDTALTGYLQTNMVVEIDVIAWLLQQGILTTIEITDLLFAGTEMLILGQWSEEVCIVLNEEDPGGGTAFIDIFAGRIAFLMTLSTQMLIGNEQLSAAIPDGFPFSTEMAAETDMDLWTMLGLMLGLPGSSMSLYQHIEDDIVIPVLGLELPAHISADMTLMTVTEVPQNDLIQGCIDFLAEEP